MVLNTKKPNTEAEALQDIVVWSYERPLWQRDALRRLCNKETLSENDFNELIAIAKGNEEGARPLDPDSLPSSQVADQTVNLKFIKNTEHVNALAQDQCLSFDKGNGITVVYGDNGSGKSGYARILKNACRARMKSEQVIHPNIYSDNPGKPRAKLSFTVGNQTQSEDWEQGKKTDHILSSVSVFDSSTANIHVDEENDVAYTPFPLEVLKRLSVACDEIQRRLRQEVLTLEKQTPDSIKNPKCKPNTEVGKIVNNLKATSNKNQIASLATLNNDEKTKNENLKADLAASPEKEARKLEATKSQLESYYATLQRLVNAAAPDKLHNIQIKLNNYHTKKEAADIAAENLFKDKALPGAGEDVWRSLWESARHYSDTKAYPNMLFPNTESGAKCVLCQQELSPEATIRLNDFENFVKNESSRQQESAQKEYRAALHEMKKLNISHSKVVETINIISDQMESPDLSKQYREAIVKTRWRIRSFLRNQSGEIEKLPMIGVMPEELYNKLIDTFKNRIVNLTAQKNSQKYQEMMRDFNELEDRIWLGIIKNDLISEIERKAERDRLQQLINESKTTAITNKSSDLAKCLITDALRAQFAKEISKLKLGDLAVELLHAKSSSGTPLFTVSLTRKPNEKKISTVLSEGEFRCIALAAFLAEQATTKSKSTLVFDDPVCSLDHMHREQIANRLADEGKERQIIIFTHDLAFLFLLESACRDGGTNIANRWVLKTDKEIGICKQEAPLKAQGIERALNSLENDLANQKHHYEKGEHIEWNARVKYYQDELRRLWERAVEESVAPVVKRFRNKVETGGLSKVTIITMDDCNKMRDGYGRCSKLMHSDGDDLNRSILKPERIQEEIAAIQDWITSVKGRQQKIG